MSNVNDYDKIFPYPLDKEDIEYLQKGVKSIFKEMYNTKSSLWDHQCYTNSVKTPYSEAHTATNCTSSEHNYHIESGNNLDSSLFFRNGNLCRNKVINASHTTITKGDREHHKVEEGPCYDNNSLTINETIPSLVSYRESEKRMQTSKSLWKNKATSTSESPSAEQLFSDILKRGIDDEDMMYLKKGFYALMWEDEERDWVQRLRWIPHPTTSDSQMEQSEEVGRLPLNKSGCARSEEYIKRSKRFSKMQAKYQCQEADPMENGRVLPYSKIYKGNKKTLSRDARNDQRRLSTAYQTITQSNLLTLNELKFRKKKLKLGKSDIHGLGLFASEPIGPNEIIIEYVGQIIRPIIADQREKDYRQCGLGYYCFLIDDGTVIDATKYGNINRYINHSCNPNSYAKVLVINNKKKIVIYSKRNIKVDEEITYDYKMKIEDDKIECLCKASTCKKSIN